MNNVTTGHLTYTLGKTHQEQIQSLYELKHTFANAIIALCESIEEVANDPEFKHLSTLYMEAHLQYENMHE